mgnify:FL=1
MPFRLLFWYNLLIKWFADLAARLVANGSEQKHSRIVYGIQANSE